jgi:hypothetical protein
VVLSHTFKDDHWLKVGLINEREREVHAGIFFCASKIRLWGSLSYTSESPNCSIPSSFSLLYILFICLFANTLNAIPISLVRAISQYCVLRILGPSRAFHSASVGVNSRLHFLRYFITPRHYSSRHTYDLRRDGESHSGLSGLHKGKQPH